MYLYLAEFIGTTMVVFMGLSVNAANSLNGSLFKGSGAVFCMMGWGLAYALPAMCFGQSSGPIFNPCFTIGLATAGVFKWSLVPGYIIAQMLGGFVGAVLMYVFYKDQFDATDNSRTILNCFATSPAIPNMPQNILCEAILTMMLVIFAVNIPVEARNMGMGYLYIWLVIMAIGYSLGGTTGFAMNPARDLSPRIAHAILPIPNKGSSDWGYAIVPIVGPLIGALLGALLGTWIAGFPAM